jgi:hypothetical protein
MTCAHTAQSGTATAFWQICRAATSGVVDINRIVGFLVLALVIYFIITEPKTAAGVVHSVAGTLRYAADSISTFFSAVL